jgi:DNA transformation protein and related proteins
MTNSFLLFVLDQFVALPDIAAKPMFGGYGVYSGETFFAIVYRGKLYLKTTEATRQELALDGMPCFSPNNKQTLKNYYEVPVSILEHREKLQAWVELSLQVFRSSNR